MKRTPFKRKATKPMKRGKLRVAGKSTTSELIKQEIQALLRQIVIKRDGGCILRGERNCGGYVGEAVLQADHLITRSNSATYADSRLVVCVCKRCHGWKSLGSNLRKAQYDALVKTVLPESRVRLWEDCERDSWNPRRTTAFDWKLAKLALETELRKMQ